jgi:hypothetical protein
MERRGKEDGGGREREDREGGGERERERCRAEAGRAVMRGAGVEGRRQAEDRVRMVREIGGRVRYVTLMVHLYEVRTCCERMKTLSHL